MLLELLAAALLCGDALLGKGDSAQKPKGTPPPPFLFEEADSYFDEYGDEHLVDDDGYCEDCDDYHDDY